MGLSIAAGAEEPEPEEPPFSSVVLLAGFEGVDESTTMVDESSHSHTMIANGGAWIDTAVKPFGTSSLELLNSTDYVLVPDSADWNFGAGAFTIEGFFNANGVLGGWGTSKYLIRQWEGAGTRGWRLVLLSGNITLSGSSDGTAISTLASGAWSPSDNTWYHIAADFDGAKYRVYVDGVMLASGATTITLFDSGADLKIGNNLGATNGILGHIKEARITKGYARYASDAGFTPPTAAFPRS